MEKLLREKIKLNLKVPLTGPNKVEAAVFISGIGSNLKSLIRFSKTKKSPISIALIVTDNSKAKGLDLAKINKIKKKIFSFKDKKLAEKRILIELKKKQNSNYLSCRFHENFIKIIY